MTQCLLKGIRKLEGVKRTTLTVRLDILEIANEELGVGITRIVYAGNLNFEMVKPHIKSLKELGLLEEEIEEENRRFKATAKGQGVLEYFKKFDKSLVKLLRND